MQAALFPDTFCTNQVENLQIDMKDFEGALKLQTTMLERLQKTRSVESSEC